MIATNTTTKLHLDDFKEAMSEAYSELEYLLDNNLCEPATLSNENKSKMMEIARMYMNNYALVVREMRKKAYAEEDRLSRRRLLNCFKDNLSEYRVVERAYGKTNKTKFLNEVFDLICRTTGLEVIQK